MRRYMRTSNESILFFHFSKQLFCYVYIPQIKHTHTLDYIAYTCKWISWMMDYFVAVF